MENNLLFGFGHLCSRHKPRYVRTRQCCSYEKMGDVRRTVCGSAWIHQVQGMSRQAGPWESWELEPRSGCLVGTQTLGGALLWALLWGERHMFSSSRQQGMECRAGYFGPVKATTLPLSISWVTELWARPCVLHHRLGLLAALLLWDLPCPAPRLFLFPDLLRWCGAHCLLAAWGDAFLSFCIPEILYSLLILAVWLWMDFRLEIIFLHSFVFLLPESLLRSLKTFCFLIL